LVERLNIERGNSGQYFRADARADITAQQPFVVSKTLRAQPRFGANLKPVIQELIQCLFRRLQIPAMIALTEHFVEISLSVPQPAMDGLVQVASILGFGVTTVVHAHKPSVDPRAEQSGRLFVP
jgi:hypothetical protein